MFDTILIANRGEIACRIIETAQAMGIKAVAVYSDADQEARHVRLADHAVHIGASPAVDSYLVVDKIIAAAKQSGAEAIHPGYGFLSENAAFAKRCADEGIVFIGPSADSIEKMGLKDRAKDIMREAGVPVVPGYQGDNQDADYLKNQADEIGYPVLIKAIAGGGGKGMRRVDAAKDFIELLASCKREAKAAFANDVVLIEKYIEKPRHIELQVFGDTQGNYVHIFERDCSVQRRHQKVVEEAPAPGIDAETRVKIGEIAVKAARAIDYTGAGTIEFIVDASKNLSADDFYFMEMNTRLQVEHPVSEMISGQDFVEWQLRIAAGEPLPAAQNELEIQGHAFELRIYAEDPAHDFVPQIGIINDVLYGDNDEFFRIDTGVEAGDQVSIYYDPMIAKLICWGENREAALKKMQRFISETAFLGVNNNQEFLRNIISHPAFIDADLHTHFVEHYEADLLPDSYAQANNEELACAALYYACGFDTQHAGYETLDPWGQHDNWRMNMALDKVIKLRHQGALVEVDVTGRDDHYEITINGALIKASLDCCDDEQSFAARINGTLHTIKTAYNPTSQTLSFLSNGRIITFQRDSHDLHGAESSQHEGQIISPMPGTIIKILVEQGTHVVKDQPLIIMEAMKLEMTLRAPHEGIIEALNHAENDQVGDGAVLLELSKNEPTAEEAA
jgi:3-methylcrotonyl-CoA carboxylase alpha subunit